MASSRYGPARSNASSTSPASPLARTPWRSSSRQGTLAALPPKRTRSPTASRLAGRASARQRSPSTRLVRLNSTRDVDLAAHAHAFERRRDDARVVEDQRIAGAQETRQIAHDCVVERLRRARPHDQQARGIARRSRGAGRCGRRAARNRTGRCACALKASTWADEGTLRQERWQAMHRSHELALPANAPTRRRLTRSSQAAGAHAAGSDRGAGPPPDDQPEPKIEPPTTLPPKWV